MTQPFTKKTFAHALWFSYGCYEYCYISYTYMMQEVEFCEMKSKHHRGPDVQNKTLKKKISGEVLKKITMNVHCCAGFEPQT